MNERKLPPPATTVEEYLYDIALGLRTLNTALAKILTPPPMPILPGTLPGSDVTVELREPKTIVLGDGPTVPAQPAQTTKRKGKGH